MWISWNEILEVSLKSPICQCGGDFFFGEDRARGAGLITGSRNFSDSVQSS